MDLVILETTVDKRSKPCKACGSEPKVEMVADLDVGEMFRVICLRCGRHTAKKISKDGAIRTWNRTN